jgi:hypothetical protein
MRCFVSVATVALVASSLLASSGVSLKTNELIMGGGSAEMDGVWISGMTLWLRHGSPGVAFGMVKHSSGPREYAYLLLIKGDPKRLHLARYDGQCRIDGALATSSGFVEIQGVRADLDYVTQSDDQGRKTAEMLRLNGKSFDLTKGRVLLVDLSGKTARLQQVPVGLPKCPAVPTTTGEIDALAKEQIRFLKKQSAPVRDFVR